MKTIQSAVFLSIFLASSFLAVSQEEQSLPIDLDGKEYFSCKYVIHSPDNDTLTLLDASLTTPIITINNARMILFDTKTKTLLAYDVDEFTIDGKIIVDSDIIEPKVLKYTLGDDKAYIK